MFIQAFITFIKHLFIKLHAGFCYRYRGGFWVPAKQHHPVSFCYRIRIISPQAPRELSFQKKERFEANALLLYQMLLLSSPICHNTGTTVSSSVQAPSQVTIFVYRAKHFLLFFIHLPGSCQLTNMKEGFERGRKEKKDFGSLFFDKISTESGGLCY